MLRHPRIPNCPVPTANGLGQRASPDLAADDTTPFGLRIDDALPSADLNVGDASVWRPAPADTLDLNATRVATGPGYGPMAMTGVLPDQMCESRNARNADRYSLRNFCV